MVHEIIPVMIGEEETNERLYTYFWSNSKELYDGRRRPCVLICPGGGYEHLSPREGEPIAMKYLAMGYHVFVLHYSLAPERFPTALRELALLTAKIREHADEWRIDSEGIIVSGFSAGGHLALSLGVHWDKEWLSGPLGLTPEQIRPNGLILLSFTFLVYIRTIFSL